jgi:uncharacterized protein
MNSANTVCTGQAFGLPTQVLSAMRDVFRQYSQVELVLIYGSRAKGNYRRGSDIDLTLIGKNLTYALLNKIETQLDDLLLPYSIDLSLFSHIDNVELVDHIKRVGKTFYP